MLNMCHTCETKYEVGHDYCPSCGQSTAQQSTILYSLLRNKSVRALLNNSYSGLRAVRNVPTMREQFTRHGAVTEVMHAAIQQDEAAPRNEMLR
eukprot:5700401-Prorocentrum_lima.AAC.1